MANQIKSVAQMVLENKGKETRKRKAEELSFKKSLASSSNSINKAIHDKKVKVEKEPAKKVFHLQGEQKVAKAKFKLMDILPDELTLHRLLFSN